MEKLVFVVSGKSPITMPGGLGAYAYNSAKIFKDLGFETIILGFSDRQESIVLENGIQLCHVFSPFSKLLGVGAFFINKVFEQKMLEIVRQKRPRQVIVLGAGFWGASGVALKKTLAKEGVEVHSMVAYFTTYRHEYLGHLKGVTVKDYGVFSYLSIWFLTLVARFIFQPVEHRMFRECDRIIVHYESTKNIITNEVRGLDPLKISKIPYYVDLFERQPGSAEINRKKTDQDSPTVSVICRQDPRKGMNTFIKSIKVLKDQGVRFNCNIAGTGVFLKQHQRLAHRLGLSDSINFLGFVPSVEKVLEDTDVYVLPSVEEGSGAISLLEAMKKGIAIVTTKCDGIPEDFVDGTTGMLVEPGNATEMAQALRKLIEDRGLRERLAANVGRDYHQRFSFDKMRQGLASVIS